MTWQAPTLGADGWMVYTPSTVGGGNPSNVKTVIVYCSDSSGANVNNGLSTGAAKRTIQDTYTFTISGTANATANATYDAANGLHLRVFETIVSGGTLVCFAQSNAGVPTSPLAKVSGTGDASISFSAATRNKGAVSAMKDAGSFAPNWLLLKRGDTFTNQAFTDWDLDSWTLVGYSTTEPILISNYDSSITTTDSWGTYATPSPKTSVLARPVISSYAGQVGVNCAGGNHGNGWINSGLNHTHWNGIEFYNRTADPANGPIVRPSVSCVSLSSPTPDIRFEDVKISWYGFGINFSKSAPVIYRSLIGNNIAQGIEGGGYEPEWTSYGVNQQAKLLESMIDHNSWDDIWENTNVNISNASPAVVTWSNQFNRTDRAQSIQFTTGNASISANTDYWIYNNNGTTFNLSSSSSSNVAVNNTGGALTGITGRAYDLGPDQRNHNVYFGGTDVMFGALDPGGYTVQKCIMANDLVNSQIRPGGLIDNNAWLKNCQSHNFGVQGGRTTQLTNNTYLDPRKANMASFSILAANTMDYYQANTYIDGSITCTGNILAHATHDTPAQGLVFTLANNTTVTGNIVYNWPCSSANAISFPAAGGLIGGGAITQGTGYTPNAFPTSGSGFADTGGSIHSGWVVINIPNSWAGGTGLADFNEGGRIVYFSGVSGSLGTLINNQLWRIEQYDDGSTDDCIIPNLALGGNSGSGGTAYFPYLVQNLSSPHSSSNSQAAVVVDGSGHVVGVSFTCFSPVSLQAGAGFQLNDDVTGTVPGGSGWSVKAGLLVNYTNSNNDKDVNGSNALNYSDPNRSVGSYYTSVGGSSSATFTGVISGGVLTISGISGTVGLGDAIVWSGQSKADYIKSFGSGSGGNGTYNLASKDNPSQSSAGSQSMASYTTDGFIASARGNTKNNWNAALTADALNIYIRAGFGIGTGTTPPVLMAQICM